MRGARITAGNIAIVAVSAIVISSAPKETIIEKIATWENHVPKYEMNCMRESRLMTGCFKVSK